MLVQAISPATELHMKDFWKGLNSGSLTQVFVTMMWQIQEPELREKRRRCLMQYAAALAILCLGVCFAFHRFGIAATCWIIGFAIWTVASGNAEQIEELVLQEKTPGPKTEGF
jgi:hypothetical protein